jgi:hypothetical protein
MRLLDQLLTGLGCRISQSKTLRRVMCLQERALAAWVPRFRARSGANRLATVRPLASADTSGGGGGLHEVAKVFPPFFWPPEAAAPT